MAGPIEQSAQTFFDWLARLFGGSEPQIPAAPNPQTNSNSNKNTSVPPGVSAAQANQKLPPSVIGSSAVTIDANGMLVSPRIVQQRYVHLEHGALPRVNGIVLHQTDSTTGQSTLATYAKPNTVNGAHFLIDEFGNISQTGSVRAKMYHVGHIQPRCEVEGVCTPQEAKTLNTLRAQRNWATAIDRNEFAKPYPQRYPYNADSIGIEVVGKATLVPGTTNTYTYAAPNAAQTAALKWLVATLKTQFGLSDQDVYRHGEIGRKQASEASTLIYK
jgi:hypothetical protein